MNYKDMIDDTVLDGTRRIPGLLGCNGMRDAFIKGAAMKFMASGMTREEASEATSEMCIGMCKSALSGRGRAGRAGRAGRGWRGEDGEYGEYGEYGEGEDSGGSTWFDRNSWWLIPSAVGIGAFQLGGNAGRYGRPDRGYLSNAGSAIWSKVKGLMGKADPMNPNTGTPYAAKGISDKLTPHIPKGVAAKLTP